MAILVLQQPRPGEIVRFRIEPETRIVVDFDPDAAELGLGGGSLVFRFASGGLIVIEGFAEVAEAKGSVSLQLPSGEIVEGAKLLEVAEQVPGFEPLETAAGEGEGSIGEEPDAALDGGDGGGGSIYRDTLVDAVGEIQRLVEAGIFDPTAIDFRAPVPIGAFQLAADLESATSFSPRMQAGAPVPVAGGGEEGDGEENDGTDPLPGFELVFNVPDGDASRGGDGDDLVLGLGDQALAGGPGDDVLLAGDGGEDVSLAGEEGDDILVGRKGDDALYGGEGDDRLIGGPGDDSLLGGAGRDSFQFNLGIDEGEDRLLDFDALGDFLSFQGIEALAELEAHVLAVVDAGTAGDLTFFFDSGSVLVFEGLGGGGIASLAALTGNLLPAQAGDQYLIGLGGAAPLVGAADEDVLLGSLFGDGLEGRGGGDILIGDRQADSLLGGGGRDVLVGEQGDDWLAGGADGDGLIGGEGSDTLHGDDPPGALPASGPPGDDLLDGGGGGDTLFGGAGDDRLDGGEDSSGDSLFGGPGADRLDGGDGPDWLDGGGGDDVLIGGFDNASDVFVVSLASGAPPDQDRILDFRNQGEDDERDVLRFEDLVDRNADGVVDLDDLDAAIVEIAFEGDSVAIAFDNGGGLRIEGLAPSGDPPERLEDLIAEIQIDPS